MLPNMIIRTDPHSVCIYIHLTDCMHAWVQMLFNVCLFLCILIIPYTH